MSICEFVVLLLVQIFLHMVRNVMQVMILGGQNEQIVLSREAGYERSSGVKVLANEDVNVLLMGYADNKILVMAYSL